RTQDRGARGVVDEHSTNVLALADGNYIHRRIEGMGRRPFQIAPPCARVAIGHLTTIEGEIRASGADAEFGWELRLTRLANRCDYLVLGGREPWRARVGRRGSCVGAGHAQDRE